MTFYNDMENAIKKHGEIGLLQLEHYYGIEIEVYRNTTDDVYSRVHGKHTGSEGPLSHTLVGVIEGSETFESNDFYSSDHVRSILYTREKDVKTGDILKVKSEDSKSRRYRVDNKRNMGFITEVFTMYGLISIGD